MTVELIEAGLQERFHELFDRAGVGIAQMDVGGRYLLVNTRYCELSGRNREELLAGRIQDFLHPDDLGTSLDAFIRAIESAQPALIEHRQVRRDGATVWISNNVSVAKGNGAPQYVLVLAHDISVRKQTEQ